LACAGPTFEGLCELFAVGHASLGIFATEGELFIGGSPMTMSVASAVERRR
jgi:hypothetical protein